MSEENQIKEPPKRLLPWKTVLLINIVNKFDACMKMPIRELAEEADYWKCRGRLKAQNRHRRLMTNAVIKKWLIFCFQNYLDSVKQGAEVSTSSAEHVGWVHAMRERGLKSEDFGFSGD